MFFKEQLEIGVFIKPAIQSVKPMPKLFFNKFKIFLDAILDNSDRMVDG
jgi:hypothetical protein